MGVGTAAVAVILALPVAYGNGSGFSDDGESMWVQSSVCPFAPAGMSNYFFSLRTMTINQ